MATSDELKTRGTEQFLAVMGALGVARDTMGSLGHTMGEILQRLPDDSPPPPPPVVEEPPAAEEPEPEDPASETGPPPIPSVDIPSWMLERAAPVATDSSPFPLVINSNQSDDPFDITGKLDGRIFIGTSQDKGWGEYGPKWLVRGYNVHGNIQSLEAWRVGDFHKGREGHVLYCNVLGDLTISNFRAVQCGGQAVQIVWRASETRIPVSDWAHASKTIVLEDVEAIDCGAINHGVAVRASWPFSIYAPGQSIDIQSMKVRTDLPGFEHPGKTGVWKSHGGLFIGPGQTYRRTPRADIDGLDIEVTQSDRECVRLWAIDNAVLTEPRVINHGGQDRISIVTDCGRVVIDRPVNDILVTFHTRAKAYGMPVNQQVVEAGGQLDWSP